MPDLGKFPHGVLSTALALPDRPSHAPARPLPHGHQRPTVQGLPSTVVIHFGIGGTGTMADKISKKALAIGCAVLAVGVVVTVVILFVAMPSDGDSQNGSDWFQKGYQSTKDVGLNNPDDCSWTTTDMVGPSTVADGGFPDQAAHDAYIAGCQKAARGQ